MRQRDYGKGFTEGEEPGTLASMVLERSTVGSLTHAELVDLVIRQSELIDRLQATIPVELEEAAMMDGATRFQALLKVVVPLALPGIVSTSIFAFTNSWNEYLYALVFIHSDTLRTLPPGTATFIQMDSVYQWGALMAGSVLITIPVLIFYMIVQRNLVVGLTEGGVKA